MQNKPNLPDAQMNVSSALTKYYENKRLCRRGENKPNSKPIKPNQTQNKPNLVRRSLGEGGFKRDTYAALRSVAQDRFTICDLLLTIFCVSPIFSCSVDK